MLLQIHILTFYFEPPAFLRVMGHNSTSVAGVNKNVRAPLNMLVTAYFNSFNPNCAVICFNSHSGNCNSMRTEANIYTIPCSFCHSVPRKVNVAPG